MLFIKGGGRTDVCLSLHLYSGQIVSHSKTSVLARGLLCGKNLIWLPNRMSSCTTVDGWATVQKIHLYLLLVGMADSFGEVIGVVWM